MILLDAALEERKGTGKLSWNDRCKLAVCEAIDQEWLRVYTARQALSPEAPAWFVGFEGMQTRHALGAVQCWSFDLRLVYLGAKDEVDGDTEAELARVLEALRRVRYEDAQFLITKRRGVCAEGAMTVSATARVELLEAKSAAEGVMRMLEETVGV